MVANRPSGDHDALDVGPLKLLLLLARLLRRLAKCDHSGERLTRAPDIPGDCGQIAQRIARG